MRPFHHLLTKKGKIYSMKSSAVFLFKISAAAVSIHSFSLVSCTGRKKERTKSVVWNDNWDTVEPEKQKNGKCIHQIILIRHGQYVQTGDHSDNDPNKILTPLGHEQAKKTGDRLGELISAGVLYEIKSVYFSTMIRASETWWDIEAASSLQEHLPIKSSRQPCSMIQEGAVCKPIPSSRNWPVSEDEFHQDHQRVEAAFLRYFHRAPVEQEEHYSTVFVCHGNIIRYLVMRALQLPPEAWLRTAVYNASITVLEIYPNGRVSLRMMGDCGHLPAKEITYS